MIFATEGSIQQIIAGKKIETRRIVKEGEILLACTYPECEVTKVGKWNEETNKEKVKWQVGRTYAVQSGRGKPCVWYCPKCKIVGNQRHIRYHILKEHNNHRTVEEFNQEQRLYQKPLRIRILEIKKQRLLDVTDDEAKKEGFENPQDFLQKFLEINWRILPCNRKRKYNKMLSFDFIKDRIGWNPETWCLEFEVVK